MCNGCFSLEKEKNTKIQALADSAVLHRLPDLYFCKDCQATRCATCCKMEVNTKYCATCLTDYTGSSDTRCRKNCVECPLCNAPLSVIQESHEKDEHKIRNIKLVCKSCEYQYRIEIQGKVRSLAAALRSERAKKNVALSEQVSKVRGTLESRYKSQQLLLQQRQDVQESRTPALSQEMKGRLQAMGLRVPQSTTEGTHTDDKEQIARPQLENKRGSNLQEDETAAEKISRHKSMKDFLTLDQQMRDGCYNTRRGGDSFTDVLSRLLHNDSGGGDMVYETRQMPLPKKLSSKKNFRCLSCGIILSETSREKILTRMKELHCAVDILPTIKVSSIINQRYPKKLHKNSSHTFLVHIINPLTTQVEVSISTTSELTTPFISSSYSRFSVFISNSSMRIDGKGDLKDPEEIVKGIPTAFLTCGTKWSRTELRSRLENLNQKKNIAVKDPKYDAGLEYGHGWLLVPLKVTPMTYEDGEHPCSIRVPLSISVRPIPSDSDTAILEKFRYWALLNLGDFLIF